MCIARTSYCPVFSAHLDNLSTAATTKVPKIDTPSAQPSMLERPPKHQKQGPSPPNSGSAPCCRHVDSFLSFPASFKPLLINSYSIPTARVLTNVAVILHSELNSGLRTSSQVNTVCHLVCSPKPGGCCDISIRLPSPRLLLVARPNPSGILPPSRSPAEKKREANDNFLPHPPPTNRPLTHAHPWAFPAISRIESRYLIAFVGTGLIRQASRDSSSRARKSVYPWLQPSRPPALLHTPLSAD